MEYKQVRTPNPNVPCVPGYCLQYTQNVFNIPAREPSAIADWSANTFNHRDSNFPKNVAVPIYFTGTVGLLAQYGHVAVRMPDGSVWSASHPTSTKPMHFASIAALEAYYSGMLQYLGWAEDVEEVRVIAPVVQTEDNKEMTTAEKVVYNKGLVLGALKPLGEGNIIFEFTVDSNQWKLDTVIGGAPVASANCVKGHRITCQAYADLMFHGKLTRYYITASDLEHGLLYGINMADVNIVATYK